MKLILASNSPRRKELLEKEGFDFQIISSEFDEKSFSSDPIKTALTFALQKAKEVFNKLEDKENAVVLGADTVVFFEEEILGKSHSKEEARAMLKRLSDKTHKVITGYAIISKNQCINDYQISEVTFSNLTDELIESYINSGLYKGKAGSYGIQDGYSLVKSYKGSLSNIIGLPVETVCPILKRLLK